MRWLILTLCLTALTAQANQPGLYCDPTAPVPNTYLTLDVCWAQLGTPLVRDDAIREVPTGWVMYANPGTAPLKIGVKYDGWGDNIIDANFAEQGKIVIKNVYSHYHLSDWPQTQFNHIDLDMGGVLHGKNANGARLVATLNEIASRGYFIDYGDGIHLGGNCYGGMAAITQSLILPDPLWQQRITVVDGLLPGMTADPPAGKYWRIRTDGLRQAFWDPYDITLAQHHLHLDKLKNIYYRFHASSYPADEIGFSQEFMTQVCDAGHIMCFATWGDQGHAWPDPDASPSYQKDMAALFSGPDMNNRLDNVMVIFTHSEANIYGPNGHYNLGMEFARSGLVDAPGRLVVPVRYLPRYGLGAGLPDQPLSNTFNLTLRHPASSQLLPGEIWKYTVGSQTGYAIPKENGEVTIPKIKLGGNAAYTNVELVKGC